MKYGFLLSISKSISSKYSVPRNGFIVITLNLLLIQQGGEPDDNKDRQINCRDFMLCLCRIQLNNNVLTIKKSSIWQLEQTQPEFERKRERMTQEIFILARSLMRPNPDVASLVDNPCISCSSHNTAFPNQDPHKPSKILSKLLALQTGPSNSLTIFSFVFSFDYNQRFFSCVQTFHKQCIYPRLLTYLNYLTCDFINQPTSQLQPPIDSKKNNSANATF